MSETLEVDLFGKSYRVACEPDERDSLVQAVALIDERAAAIRGKTRSASERLAAMVALELAHELVQLRSAGGGLAEAPLKRRIESIEARIAAALERNEALF